MQEAEGSTRLHDALAARDAAGLQLRSSGHQLYRHNGKLYSAKCQKYKTIAAFGRARPAAASSRDSACTEPGSCTGGQHEAGAADKEDGSFARPSASAALHNPVSAEDASDWFTFGIEHANEFLDEQAEKDRVTREPAQASLAADLDAERMLDGPGFCSVSAAKKARSAYRKEVTAIDKRNRATCTTAHAHPADASAAAGLAECLAKADGMSTSGPPWAEEIHGSHSLYYFGGIVACGKCGAMAQRKARCLLAKQCRDRLAKWNRRELRRLAQGRLPRSDYAEWPDGGADVRANARLRRIP